MIEAAMAEAGAEPEPDSIIEPRPLHEIEAATAQIDAGKTPASLGRVERERGCRA
jgi:hypothetical protein